jgi:hypothetical protein
MPGARCARSLVCEVGSSRCTRVFTAVAPEITRHPRTQWFTAYFVLSPAIGLSCHRRLADIGTSARSGSRTSARLDAGVEASGPHDFAVRCSAVRLRAQGIAHGSIKPALRSHLARGHRRVHRIPPRVNDDGQRPSVGRDGGGYRFDLGFGKTEIFLQMGLDRQKHEPLLICPSGAIGLNLRERFSPPSFRGARSANPESRDSESGPSDHPGMTGCAVAHPSAPRNSNAFSRDGKRPSSR